MAFSAASCAWLLPPLVAHLGRGEARHKPLRRALRLATLLARHAGCSCISQHTTCSTGCVLLHSAWLSCCSLPRRCLMSATVWGCDCSSPEAYNPDLQNITNEYLGGCRRPEEARLLWRHSTAAFGASSHPGVQHEALRCAGAVLGRLRRLHAGTPAWDTSLESPAADAPAGAGAATGSAAAAAAADAAAAGRGDAKHATDAAATDSAEAGNGGDSPGSLDATAGWLLEAADGGAGAGQAPELRLAIADAIAAAGGARRLSFAACFRAYIDSLQL